MIITQTPLRVSFLGGNTDFPEYYLKHGGLVLTSTIDKYIYCIVKERFDDLVIVNYSVKETVTNISDLKHELVREALRMLDIRQGIEISFLADIPSEGTGLGSSSAVTVGVLNALHTFKGENVSSDQLAQEAIKIELEILGKPIGVQDQYATALGGIRLIEFLKHGGFTSKRLPIGESIKEDLNNSLMMLYTGITRDTNQILASLDLNANLELLETNKIMVVRGAETLKDGALGQFGALLNSYWKMKKKLSNKISNPQIDEMYQKAMDAGAIGGKVLGAGGGGFLLVMFPANKRAKVRESLKNYKELPFRFSNSGSKVIFNA